MGDELKPCPTCKSNNIAYSEGAVELYMVWCVDCFTGTGKFPTLRAAVTIWNHRPIESSLTDKLRVGVDGIKDNNYAWDRIANRKTSAVRADELCDWAKTIIKSNKEALRSIEQMED
jgi:hypothetical protein